MSNRADEGDIIEPVYDDEGRPARGAAWDWLERAYARIHWTPLAAPQDEPYTAEDAVADALMSDPYAKDFIQALQDSGFLVVKDEVVLAFISMWSEARAGQITPETMERAARAIRGFGR